MLATTANYYHFEITLDDGSPYYSSVAQGPAFWEDSTTYSWSQWPFQHVAKHPFLNPGLYSTRDGQETVYEFRTPPGINRPTYIATATEIITLPEGHVEFTDGPWLPIGTVFLGELWGTTPTSTPTSLEFALYDVRAVVMDVMPGDTDYDADVDFVDFIRLSKSWKSEGMWHNGDFTGDKQVDFADFALLSNNFSWGTGSVASVPEPSTIALIVLATLTLVPFYRQYLAQ
jgi:hypothetical protein